MGHWAWLLPRRDWVTTPSRYRLICFICFPFDWETSSYNLCFVERSLEAGTDNQCALYLSSRSWVFMMWKIHFWRWSSMLISNLWWRSGFRRSVTIQGICRTTLNSLWNGATRVWHWLPSCWHRWAFDIDCDPAGGVDHQEGHNLQVHSWDTRTKNTHAAPDDVGHCTQGNLQAMLLKPDRKAWSYDLHREHCNTHSWHCNFE